MNRIFGLLGGGLTGGLCWYAPDLLSQGIFWPLAVAFFGGLVAALFFQPVIRFYHFGIVSCVVIIFLLRITQLIDALVPVLLAYTAVVAVSSTTVVLTDYLRQIIILRRS